MLCRFAAFLLYIALLGRMSHCSGETDASTDSEISRLTLRKAVLTGEEKLMSIVQAMRTVAGFGLSEEVAESVAEHVRDIDDILARMRSTGNDEEKIAIINAGLAKRHQWLEALAQAKSKLEQLQNFTVDDSGSGAKNGLKIRDEELEQEEESAQEEIADDMITSTARMIQMAIREGKIDVVVKVLQAMKNTPATISKLVNRQDRVGATVLHWCAFYGGEAHAVLAKTFLAFPEADAQILDNHNNSACHTACMKGHAEVLSVLISASRGHSCNPLARGGDGQTCVHHAARRGDVLTLSKLESRLTHLSVNELARSTGTETPLVLAIESGSLEAVRILLKAGAVASSENSSAIQYAHGKLEEARQQVATFESLMEELTKAAGQSHGTKHADLRADL